MSVHHFTDENYTQEVTQHKGYVLMDFWAEWCGPCRQLGPVIEALAIDMAGRVKIGKMNVDENPETPSKFGVRSIPTLALFLDGKHIATKVGSLPKSALIEWIEAQMK